MTTTENRKTAPQDGAVAVEGSSGKRAVLYLRVSTPSQVNTDYNPEGISLSGQRDACAFKAAQMQVEIAREFLEPGKTATSIEKRPVFQEMLAWVKAERNIDYIIVYNFNRIFRNSVDAAVTKRDLKKHGVRVVSTLFDTGEGPEANMIETIMHAVDQYSSENSAATITFMMARKVRTGGTPSRAPLGYLNVRDRSEGRNIGTVIPDPDRASLVRQAFELYATDNYTLTGLAERMEELGLQTRPGPATASKPVSETQLQSLLQNRYYIGFIDFKGEEIQGKHEPIVDPMLFERVQLVMEGRGRNHVRKRTHDHYLKGTLWCWSCHQQGRECRLIRQQSTGKSGGLYEYFFCRGRQEGYCSTSHLWVSEVEEAIEKFYGRIKLPEAFVDDVRSKVKAVIDDAEHSTTVRKKQIDRDLTRLSKKEDRLLDLAVEGELPSSKVRERLREVEGHKHRLVAERNGLDERLD